VKELNNRKPNGGIMNRTSEVEVASLAYPGLFAILANFSLRPIDASQAVNKGFGGGVGDGRDVVVRLLVEISNYFGEGRWCAVTWKRFLQQARKTHRRAKDVEVIRRAVAIMAKEGLLEIAEQRRFFGLVTTRVICPTRKLADKIREFIMRNR